MGEKKNAHRILVWIPEWYSPTGRPRYKWEDSIRTDAEEGCAAVDRIHMI
jgi:maltoporin